MKPCTLCKVSPRKGKSSWCPSCTKLYLKRYKEDHKEHIRDLNRNWRSSNREHYQEYRDTYYRTVHGRCVELCRSCKRRSLKRGITFDLDTAYLEDLWEKQYGCCLLTGIQLNIPPESTGGLHFYDSPSIDRIDPKGGYTKDNVRLVCYGVNCCLHDFGELVFKKVSEILTFGKSGTWVAISRQKLEPTAKQRDDRKYRQSFEGTVTALYHAAKKNSKEKGITCTISKNLIHDLLRDHPSCTLTGIKFDLRLKQYKLANPFRPSVDRIDPSRGYEPDNIRLVCVAVNYALNEFGETTLRTICQAYLSRCNQIHAAIRDLEVWDESSLCERATSNGSNQVDHALRADTTRQGNPKLETRGTQDT